MSLGRSSVTRVECAVGDDAWRESGDRSARADSDVARNLTCARIGDGGSTEDGEGLG
jgi:hypothetical protein